MQKGLRPRAPGSCAILTDDGHVVVCGAGVVGLALATMLAGEGRSITASRLAHHPDDAAFVLAARAAELYAVSSRG